MFVVLFVRRERDCVRYKVRETVFVFSQLDGAQQSHETPRTEEISHTHALITLA